MIQHGQMIIRSAWSIWDAESEQCSLVTMLKTLRLLQQETLTMSTALNKIESDTKEA